jgi:nucleoside phosphorylase
LIVVNIGTAGALRDGLEGLHLPGAVINHDLSADAIRTLGIDVTDRIDLPGGDGLVLATGDSFVAEPGQRTALAARASLVDMEGFAVAWACRQAGVACRLVKHVSDNADGAAMAWAEVVDHSAAVLGDWLARTF